MVTFPRFIPSVVLLDGRDARGIEPALDPRILGCLYYPHGGNANPVKTVLALAPLAQQHMIVQEMLDVLHDFKEVVTFKVTGGWMRDEAKPSTKK